VHLVPSEDEARGLEVDPVFPLPRERDHLGAGVVCPSLKPLEARTAPGFSEEPPVIITACQTVSR
jgi:hypothetical protein